MNLRYNKCFFRYVPGNTAEGRAARAPVCWRASSNCTPIPSSTGSFLFFLGSFLTRFPVPGQGPPVSLPSQPRGSFIQITCFPLGHYRDVRNTQAYSRSDTLLNVLGRKGNREATGFGFGADYCLWRWPWVPSPWNNMGSSRSAWRTGDFLANLLRALRLLESVLDAGEMSSSVIF